MNSPAGDGNCFVWGIGSELHQVSYAGISFNTQINLQESDRTEVFWILYSVNFLLGITHLRLRTWNGLFI